MNCPKCNSILPDDSEFCQYCGTRIDLPIIENSNEMHVQAQALETTQNIQFNNDNSNISGEDEATIAVVSAPQNGSTQSETKSKNAKYCKECGGYIDPDTKKCDNCGKQYFKLRVSPIIILLSVLLIVSASVNVYQYLNIQENTNKIAELEKTVASQKKTVTSQKSTITSLNAKVEKVTKKAEAYDDIISALNSGNLGYASNNFKSSESVIVVSENQSNRKFTLTANWTNGGTVSVDYSPLFSSASVSFDNDEWSASTTMTIHPYVAGVTTATFSNSVNDRTFKVVIIVTE